MLSVCMIVRDEEKVLEGCLKQVVRFSDELIIVDTGSKDATKEIAARYTDKVYEHAWTGDFSEARNRSFSYATHAYVMWMDADHILDEEAVERLIALKKELADREEPYGSVCVNYLSPDNLKVPVSFHMIMRRGDSRTWTGAVHERYPLREPVLYADVTIRHSERKEENRPVNLKSILYADYIKKISDDELRDCFWLGMQCYVDLIFAAEKEEAERILAVSLEKKPPLEELLRTCLLAGNNFLYWKRYEDALKVYELFFRDGSYKNTQDQTVTPAAQKRLPELTPDALKQLPPEIQTSPSLRMLLSKAQKCAYECGETRKAIALNDMLLFAFPDNVAARWNRNYYDSFRPVSLSICMIVRDEEPVLERILQKVKQFADELIVVDTGSKDRSKEIAMQYTDKVFDYVWDDDFAAARNFSYEKASCDYIMWLDADDNLEKEDIGKLRYLKQHFPGETDVLMLYYTGDPDEKEILNEGGVIRDRWIRRSLHAKWEFPIHEAIPIRKTWKVLNRPDIRIFHRKLEVNEEHRNMRIFERKLKEGFRMIAFNRSYYVRELTTERRYEEARTAFEELWIDGREQEINYALFYYIFTMKCLKQKTKLRELLEQYLARFGSSEMVYCTLGDLYREEKLYEEAIRHYRMARGVQIDMRDGMVHKAAFHDFLPWLGLAKTCLRLGEPDKAEDAIRHAECSYPNDLQVKIIRLNLENSRRREEEKKKNEILSIILPVYNAQDTVLESIESVLAVKGIPIEILIVDDGSTDETGAIVERYAKEEPRIRLIRQQNAGPGAARNTGLRNVSGAYLGFMDADDRYVPEVLERVWHLLAEGEADAVCVGIRMVQKTDAAKEDGIVLYQGDDSLIQGKEAFRRMLAGEGLDSNTYAKFYRKDRMPSDLHFFEGMLGDDIPVTYRMLLASEKVYLTKEIGYLYHVDGDEKSLSGVVFAPYFFDMTDRAKELYELVLQEYPEFCEEAAGFYLDLVLQCVERILALENQEPYREGLKELLKILDFHKEELKRTTRIDKNRKQRFSLFLLSCKLGKMDK
ncbi:MAG: glycosyltransferase [Lachnospiraceae bacterium]|nr:glycosyltransferase [Lachnospiraceae bacterium]